MAKVPATQIDSILGDIANSTLTANEIKVFSAWFRDAPGFSANPDMLAERTGIKKSNIKIILRSLVTKGVLKKGGMIRTSNNQYVQSYDFIKIPQKGDEIEVNRGLKKDKKEGSIDSPIYTNKHTNKSTKSRVKKRKCISKEEVDVSITLEDLDKL